MFLRLIIPHLETLSLSKFHNVPFAKCATQAHPRHSQNPQIHPAHQTPHTTTSKTIPFTPHHLYLTLLLQHPLHLKPPSTLTPPTNPCSRQLLRSPSTSLQPTLNTLPSLASTNLLNLLLCPNSTPRFRPFFLTSTHKNTTIKPPIKPP